MIPGEVLSVVGMAVLAEVGETMLSESGHNRLATYLKIICYVGGTVILVKFVWEGVRESLAVVGIYI